MYVHNSHKVMWILCIYHINDLWMVSVTDKDSIQIHS